MLNENGYVEPFLHFIFVRKSEFEAYFQNWGNFVAIVEMPDKMNDVTEDIDQGGVGYVRRFMQRFAHFWDINNFYMCDDMMIYFQQGKID